MTIQDETEARRTDSLNGFLSRWRRNASHAGVVSAVVTVCVLAAALLVVAACHGLAASGRTYP